MAKTLKIYNYRIADGSFDYESEAVESPLEPGEFIIPAFATTKKVPKVKKGTVAVFNETEDKWIQVSDHRGETIYSKQDGSATVFNLVGDIPQGYTTKEKPGMNYSFNEESGKWEVDEELDLLIKKQENKKYLNKKREEGVQYAGEVFNADDKTTQEITNILVACPDELPEGFKWMTQDGKDFPMTREQLQKLAFAIFERNQRVFSTYRTKKRKMEAFRLPV